MESNTIKALLCLQDLALRLNDETAIAAVSTIHDALKQTDQWQAIATYFGDCAAASAETITKSTSAAQKRRHQSICVSFSEMLKHGRLDKPNYSSRSDAEKKADVIERLLKASKRLEEPK